MRLIPLFCCHCLLAFLCVFQSCSPMENQPKSTTPPVQAETTPTYKYTGEPLRVGLAGLVHTHVHWLLGRENFGDIEIVGIAEANRELAERYCQQHGLSTDLIYPDLPRMVEATQPEAITAFNTTYDHLATVQYCAPRGIHVMVEKPLAVSEAHANEMIELANKYQIELLTNYETSWYGSNFTAYDLIKDQKAIGPIRRMVFRTGHPGPVEIGCNIEFLDWLTDPVKNGGGVLMDFGCYGANLATWMMQGEPPLTVSCITQQIKPSTYPKVEDEANIMLTYPQAQVLIQASWNWSHNLKEMDVYGTTGYIHCQDRSKMQILQSGADEPTITNREAAAPTDHFYDPFAYLAAVIKKGYQPAAFDLSSPENNAVVMRILEAAKQSAESGQVVPY